MKNSKCRNPPMPAYCHLICLEENFKTIFRQLTPRLKIVVGAGVAAANQNVT